MIRTPGHSPGSTCFVVTGDDRRTYLFTGDTVFRDAGGSWRAGSLPGISDASALEASLRLLSTLEPDPVVSSAFAGDQGAHVMAGTAWATCADEARASLAGVAGRTAPRPPPS